MCVEIDERRPHSLCYFLPNEKQKVGSRHMMELMRRGGTYTVRGSAVFLDFKVVRWLCASFFALLPAAHVAHEQL